MHFQIGIFANCICKYSLFEVCKCNFPFIPSSLIDFLPHKADFFNLSEYSQTYKKTSICNETIMDENKASFMRKQLPNKPMKSFIPVQQRLLR